MSESKETPKQEDPKPKAKAKSIPDMYWKNPTYFQKFGTVTGLVTKAQAAEFNKITPKETSLSNWTLSYDPIAKRLKEAKAKSRKRAGLPEEK